MEWNQLSEKSGKMFSNMLGSWKRNEAAELKKGQRVRWECASEWDIEWRMKCGENVMSWVQERSSMKWRERESELFLRWSCDDVYRRRPAYTHSVSRAWSREKNEKHRKTLLIRSRWDARDSQKRSMVFRKNTQTHWQAFDSRKMLKVWN